MENERIQAFLEKEKMAVTNIFSFFHNVFTFLRTNLSFLSTFKLSSANYVFNLDKFKIYLFRKELVAHTLITDDRIRNCSNIAFTYWVRIH